MSGLSRPPFCADLDGNGNFVEEPQLGINEECIMNNEKCRLTNYPNPFYSTTVIRYGIPRNLWKIPISLNIYNIRGQLVKTLINNQTQKGGYYEMIWDGTDNAGQVVSSGVYLYKLQSKTKVITRKLILLK
jgi:hypothetical protein